MNEFESKALRKKLKVEVVNDIFIVPKFLIITEKECRIYMQQLIGFTTIYDRFFKRERISEKTI